MTAAELIAIREGLGLRRDALAAQLSKGPSVVEAWERGRRRIPASVATFVRLLAASAEQEKVLAASGFDALHPLRHRLIGYVLRGALGLALAFGTMAFLTTLALDHKLSWSPMLDFVEFTFPFGGAIGAVAWLWSRLTGRLPKQRLERA